MYFSLILGGQMGGGMQGLRAGHVKEHHLTLQPQNVTEGVSFFPVI